MTAVYFISFYIRPHTYRLPLIFWSYWTKKVMSSYKQILLISLRRLTSICCTVRSRKVFSLRTLIKLLGPLHPMLVPRPPFSFTTTSLFRQSATLSGRPRAWILSYGWICRRGRERQVEGQGNSSCGLRNAFEINNFIIQATLTLVCSAVFLHCTSNLWINSGTLMSILLTLQLNANKLLMFLAGNAA